MISTGDVFGIFQGLLGARVLGRMLATAAGDPIAATSEFPPEAGSVVVLLPVSNEVRRIGPCLEGLLAQPQALRAAIVVDGGSTDGTQDAVRAFAARDPRVVLIDAPPVADGWNGKAWNLACGLAASDPDATWILTIDADVRPAPNLIASLLAHAASAYLDAFSAAPLFELSGAAESGLHPAFLATLVYRYGLPGNVARTAREVQANGQCFLAKRALLVRTGAFGAARASRCEDVSIARHLVRGGAQVGFFEGGRLARVRMYAGARECWANWPRSLPLRDAGTTRVELALALAEIGFVQTLPALAVLWTLAARADTRTPFFRLNLALLAARLGVLAGTRRAYRNPGALYWFSALADLPVFLRILASSLTEKQTWRGRALVPQARLG